MSCKKKVCFKWNHLKGFENIFSDRFKTFLQLSTVKQTLGTARPASLYQMPWITCHLLYSTAWPTQKSINSCWTSIFRSGQWRTRWRRPPTPGGRPSHVLTCNVSMFQRTVRDARRSSRGVKLLISEVPGGGRAAVGRSEVNKEWGLHVRLGGTPSPQCWEGGGEEGGGGDGGEGHRGHWRPQDRVPGQLGESSFINPSWFFTACFGCLNHALSDLSSLQGIVWVLQLINRIHWHVFKNAILESFWIVCYQFLYLLLQKKYNPKVLDLANPKVLDLADKCNSI